MRQHTLWVPKARTIMQSHQNTDDQRREQSADDFNRLGNSSILWAAQAGILGVVRNLCEAGVNPSCEQNSVIAHAACGGHLDMVRYLCELPRDRGVNPHVGLPFAAFCGQLAVVRYLCELPRDRGVNPHAGLPKAARDGQLEVVRYLCELPRDRGVNPHVGLCPAARDGQLEVVRYLCELPRDRGVNPHVGLCPAASAGQLEVVRYLCELPPDRLFPKATDASAASDCPIHAAAIKGHQDVVRYLCGVQAADGASAATPGRVGEGNALPCGDGSAGRLPPEGRHANVVRYLCELPAYRGLDPSCDGGSPAGLAARLDRLSSGRCTCETSEDRGGNPLDILSDRRCLRDEYMLNRERRLRSLVRYMHRAYRHGGVRGCPHVASWLTPCTVTWPRSPLLWIWALVRQRRARAVHTSA